MVGVNTQRRAQEEALRRRVHRNRAERLSDLRRQFTDFMNQQGLSDYQKEKEIEKLEELIDYHDYMAEEGVID